MIHSRLSVGRWKVDFLFAVEYDIDAVIDILQSAGVSEEHIRKAYRMMRSNKPNCGFTAYNSYRRTAVVLIGIGPTTSGAEFLDTLVHEIHHLSDAIVESLGLQDVREPAAYSSGDTVRALAEIICRLGCDCS